MAMQKPFRVHFRVGHPGADELMKRCPGCGDVIRWAAVGKRNWRLCHVWDERVEVAVGATAEVRDSRQRYRAWVCSACQAQFADELDEGTVEQVRRRFGGRPRG